MAVVHRAIFAICMMLLVLSTLLLGITSAANAAEEGPIYPAAHIIVLSGDSDVTVIFQESEAGCDNLFGLWSPTRIDLGWGQSTPVGTEFNLGRFPAGTELIFFIYHPCSGYTWLNGPGERNADGQVHAATSELGYQIWYLGFEDLPGGGDRDFNDIILLVAGDLYVGPALQNVTIDIKPGSDPNSINVNSKGVLPAAILGTDDFDATQVDPETVLLSWDGISGVPGVPPLRWAWEDVNGDGIMDISLKYSMGDLMTVTVTNEPPGEQVWTLMGFLKAEFGGTLIVGEDTVRIINKGYAGP